MPNLRKLRLTNMDPLCHTDDISSLLLHSQKLKELAFHWSPCVRERAEPIIDLRLYFVKCLEARCRMPLESLSLQNFCGANITDLELTCHPKTLSSINILNCSAGNSSEPSTLFVDAFWKEILKGKSFRNVKSVRCSEISGAHATFLSSVAELNGLYLIGDKASANTGVRRDSYWNMRLPNSSLSEAASPMSVSRNHSSPDILAAQTNAAICKQYLRVLSTFHGQTITRLLLHDTWAISGDQLSELVNLCPNLDQLGLAISEEDPQSMRILFPFLKKLRYIRFLDSPGLRDARQNEPVMAEMLSPKALEPRLWRLSPDTQLEWAGFGDLVFRIGKSIQVFDELGEPDLKKEVWKSTLDDVEHIDIWKMDCMEI